MAGVWGHAWWGVSVHEVWRIPPLTAPASVATSRNGAHCCLIFQLFKRRWGCRYKIPILNIKSNEKIIRLNKLQSQAKFSTRDSRGVTSALADTLRLRVHKAGIIHSSPQPLLFVLQIKLQHCQGPGSLKLLFGTLQEVRGMSNHHAQPSQSTKAVTLSLDLGGKQALFPSQAEDASIPVAVQLGAAKKLRHVPLLCWQLIWQNYMRCKIQASCVCVCARAHSVLYAEAQVSEWFLTWRWWDGILCLFKKCNQQQTLLGVILARTQMCQGAVCYCWATVLTK